MINLLFRKSLYDGIDNLGVLILFNFLLSVIPVGLGILVFKFLSESLVGLMFFGFCIVLLESFLSFGINGIVYKWSCNSFGNFSDFRNVYKGKVSHVLLHSIVVFICIVMIPFSQVFFLYFGNFLGLLACLTLFWAELIIILCIQFYYPVCYYYADSSLTAVGTFKQSFILVVGNLGYSFFLLLRSVFDLALSVLSASLVPGLGGICLSRMDTVRLLLIKYNNGLEEEDKLVGRRTVKTILFPWKDKNN